MRAGVEPTCFSSCAIPPTTPSPASCPAALQPGSPPAHLAHILGLGHLLADDGLLVTSVVAGAPAEHGVGAVGDVTLPTILDLQCAWVGREACVSRSSAETAGLHTGACPQRRTAAEVAPAAAVDTPARAPSNAPAACGQKGWGPGRCCRRWGSRCAPNRLAPAGQVGRRWAAAAGRQADQGNAAVSAFGS